MPAARTLEQRVKTDHGLTIGRHLVRFTLGEQKRIALVEISPRGKVGYLLRPDADDMYSTWRNMKGDTSTVDGVVIVWAARNAAVMAQFDREPVADIPVRV